ncbi:MAG: hypothetical protein WB780_17875 [Candidatus Acidiferrales bacterium]
MSRASSLAMQLVITAVLAAAISFAIPVLVDRHDYANAVENYSKDRTPANEAILKVEWAKNQQIALRTHLEAAGALFLLLNAGCFALRRWSALASKKR